MKLKNYKELFEKYEDTDYEDESYYNDDDYLFGRPSHSKKGTEEEEDEQNEMHPGMKLTKDGYLCDDFIVDDEETDYDNLSLEDDNNEEEDEVKKNFCHKLVAKKD
jgi:hypothetical protein